MANIEYLLSQHQLNKILAPLPIVQDAVKDKGKEVERKATANLAATRDEGRHEIQGGVNIEEKYGFLDYEIALVGPAPLSVEFGHFVHNALFPRYVAGQYILYRAAGLI